MRFSADLIALKKDSGEDQVEILLVVCGEWQGHRAGAFRIDSGDLEKIKINFDARKVDTVIDYEHQSLYGNEAPAAGWIKSMHIKDNKLYGMVSWTDRAKEYIKNGEYRYLSPVFNFAAVDKKSGAWIGCELESVAFTNTPFLDELDEVRANKALSPSQKEETTNHKGENMDKLKELENENLALKATLEESKNEIKALKDQLCQSEVKHAIFENKLSQDQEKWALSYAKNDLFGFREFLQTVKSNETAKIPNDIFAGKANNTDELDVIKLALQK